MQNKSPHYSMLIKVSTRKKGLYHSDLYNIYLSARMTNSSLKIIFPPNTAIYFYPSTHFSGSASPTYRNDRIKRLLFLQSTNRITLWSQSLDFCCHCRASWKSHFKRRNLIALSTRPLLLFPTHYTGEPGYVSDTEDSTRIVAEATPKRDDLWHAAADGRNVAENFMAVCVALHSSSTIRLPIQSLKRWWCKLVLPFN